MKSMKGMVINPTKVQVIETSLADPCLPPEDRTNQADESDKVRNSKSWKHITEFISYEIIAPYGGAQ